MDGDVCDGIVLPCQLQLIVSAALLDEYDALREKKNKRMNFREGVRSDGGKVGRGLLASELARGTRAGLYGTAPTFQVADREVRYE